MIFIEGKLQYNTEKECVEVHNCDILNVYRKKESTITERIHNNKERASRL